jgi:hypothetical protein
MNLCGRRFLRKAIVAETGLRGRNAPHRDRTRRSLGPAGAPGFGGTREPPGESSVSLSVTDTTGLPVAFDVAQWDPAAPDGQRILGSFCSITPSLRLPLRGHSVIVYINVGSCSGMPSVPTTGTATATYR